MRTLTPLVQQAMILATTLHWNQRRKADRYPYIIHPFSVMYIVSRYTSEESILCAALLHDVLEDVPEQQYSRLQMQSQFGERVAALVYSVSEDKKAGMTKEEEKKTWQQRKNSYLAKLKTATDEGTSLIAAADKIHNIQSMIDVYPVYGEELWQAFSAPKEKTLWFYDEVIRALKAQSSSPIIKELDAIYLLALRIFRMDLA